MVAAAVPYLVTNSYLFHLLIMAVIWSILATSLNLVLGYTGLLSLAHGAFFGLGRLYLRAAGHQGGWNFWATIPPAMAVAAAGRRRARRADSAAGRALFRHQHAVVRHRRQPDPGEMGRPDRRPARHQQHPRTHAHPLFGLGQVQFESNVAKYYLAVATLAICLLFVWRLVHSPIGRALEAIRQNELLASCLGVNLVFYKLLAFSISAAMAGLAGVLYSVYITYSIRRMPGCGTASMP